MRIFSIILMLMELTFHSNAEAKQHRSYEAKAEFKRHNPCPANGHTRGPCPGYIVDHVKPLACGGADNYTNMQWQTKADSDAKDKWERIGCTGEHTD